MQQELCQVETASETRSNTLFHCLDTEMTVSNSVEATD